MKKRILAAAVAFILAAASGSDAGETLPYAPGLMPTVLIELDGTSSENPEGGELEYEWTQIDGPHVELSDNRAAKPYFRTGRPGKYCFQLVVSANGLKSEPFPVEIVIVREKPPPVAKLPPEITGEVGKPMLVDGSKSFDPDGEALSYRWRLLGGSLGVPADALDKPSFSFIPDRDGVYEIELVVSDGRVASRPAVATLRIRPPRRPPRANATAKAIQSAQPSLPEAPMVQDRGGKPFANIEGPGVAKAGETVMLDARGSGATGNSRLKYLWKQKSGPFIPSFELIFDGAAERFKPPEAGEYEFELIVSDGALDSLPAIHRLIVVGESEPPVAVVVAPERAVPGALVKLDASQSYDREGSRLIFKWRQLGGPSVKRYIIDEKIGDSAPAFHPPSPGLYTFELVVSNGRRDSQPVEINIDVIDRSLSVNLAIAGPQAAKSGERFTLTARLGSDNGKGLTLSWRQVEGPDRIMPPTTGSSVNVIPSLPGKYVFEAQAADGAVAVASVRQTVEVFPAAVPAASRELTMPVLQPLPALPVAPVSPAAPPPSPPELSSMTPPAPSLRNRIGDLDSSRIAAQVHPSATGGLYPFIDDPLQPIPPLPTIPDP